MKKPFIACLAALLASLPCIGTQGAPDPSAAIFGVRDFGAVGDGATKDTAAVQRAIDAAASAGGGEVWLADGTFLCGSLYLKSHVALHVGTNAVLKASPDRADYNAADVCPQNWTSVAESNSGAHLLLCIGQTNVAVRGEGRIDGNSAAFLLNPATGKPWPGGQGAIPWRPGQMLYFVESQDIRVEGLTLQNAPYWSCFFHGCVRVAARGLTVRTIRRPFHTHNGDGIDIDSCEDVEVADCDIDTADDSITLRADVARLRTPRPCANVRVRNCSLSSGCNAIRLGVGDGEVRDASFRDIRIHGSRTAVNAVGAWRKGGRGTDIRRVSLENLDIEARNFCHIYYRYGRECVFEDIAFRHVRGKVSGPSVIEDTSDRPFRNLVFEDVELEGETSPRVLKTASGQQQREAVASVGFGGGLSLPGGATFVPWSFDSNWKPHGASGAPGGAFVLECSPATENAADFGLVLNGSADFRETGDGGIEAVWSVHANRKGSPRFVGIQCSVPKAAIPGGLRADATNILVGTAIPPSPHIFSGKVRSFSFLGKQDSAWLTLDFPEPQEILVQDNARWGTQNISLRIFLVSEEIEPGHDYTARAVFRVPATALSLNVPEPVRAVAGEDWIPLPPPEPGTDWIEPGSALDFSAVVPRHEPAGKFGRVVAVGDHFELEQRPGEEIRFCGVNLVHGANVPEPEDADRFAANLARMGFNSVRIHHHEAFLVGAKPRGDGAALDVTPQAWAKFDALVAACVRHGLYLTTDLFVSRTKGMTWRAIGIDRDGTVPDREFKLMCAFYEPAYSNLVEWTRIFLTHVNPHTGRSLAEEPALCGIGLINEGNLGRDGVEGLLKCPGFAEAWAAAGGAGGAPRPLPTDVYGKKPAAGELALFLAEREKRLFTRLRSLLRDELGCRAPLSNLNAGYYPGQYLLPMRDFDYIDTHFYYYHPRFLGKNWRFPTVCEAENPLRVNGGVPSATWRRVLGKPFCITEWNWAAPGPHRAASGLVTGSLAARQNWSGIWRFAWSHTKQGVEAPGSMPIRFFDLHSDPVQRASEYATLALYLRGDMAPLTPGSESAEVWREEELLNPTNGAAQFGSPRKDVSVWEHRVGARLVAGADAPATSEPTEVSPSDRAVAPDVATGCFRVVTPRTCGGFAEAGALECGPLRFEIAGRDGPALQDCPPAAVWASSLDGRPLAESSRILVAHVTDAANTGAVFDGPESRSWLEQGSTPPLVRRGKARIELVFESEDSGRKAPAVFRLSPTGHRAAEVSSTFDAASCRLSFTADTGCDTNSATLFYEIVRQQPDPVVATATWGAGLGLGGPADILFTPAAYTPAWKFRGAKGGARVEGARAFSIELSGNTGENIAAGAVTFKGRAAFAGTDDGALDADWSVVPDRDATLPEVMVETRIPLGRVAGGFLADGRPVPIEPTVPTNAHLFRGSVSRVDLLGAEGRPWLRIDFPSATPILLQDNRAWGGTVATLRMFFAQKSVVAGRTYPVHARFSVPGRAIQFEEAGQVEIQAGADWIPYPAPEPGADWIEAGSALDLAATLPRHEPAGKFGRVVVVDDHFELEQRPGEEIRFCGVNLVHGANTPSAEAADRFAANLARMGFNSVRIHHHERPLLAKPAASAPRAALAIDTNALDRFDALVAACVRHGLYLTTDLYVSRAPVAWRAVGIDRKGDMDKNAYKRLVVFHEGAFSNLVAWTRAFLGHVNPYTGRSLAEEPALATLALVNEGNLGNWGRDALLSTPGVQEAWQAWLSTNSSSVIRHSSFGDAVAVPADLYASSGEKKALADAFALFLAESEERFYRRLAAIVRDELGCKAPLSNLSSWYNPAAYTLARAAFDYDDDHGYVDHPFFLGKSWGLPSTHHGANPMLGGDAVPAFAWRRLFGKPFCVTEWNWSAPGQYRQASGLVMGALAARQGWNGLWRFAWSHDRAGVEAPGSIRMRYFDLHADPSLRASARAAICLFLRGDLDAIPPAAASPVEVDEAALRRGEDAARRMTMPVGATSGWKRRIGVRLNRGETAENALSVPPTPDKDATDTQSQVAEVDSKRGSFRVITPRTCGGFAPSGALDCGPLRFEIAGRDGPALQDGSLSTNHSSFVIRHSSFPDRGGASVAAAVWANSLDGAPIERSSRILLAHVTDSKNTGAQFDDPECRVWLDYGKLPALVRHGKARIELVFESEDGGREAPAVFRLSPTGHRVAEVPAAFDAASRRLSFTADTGCDPNFATLFYEIVRRQSAGNN